MIVFFWFVFGTNVHFLVHSYFIETQPSVWGKASCQIAFPVLNFSGSTPSIDSTEDISNLTIPGKGVWIGYYQAMVTYTYVGNGRRDQYEGQIYDVQSLGDCISATGCKTFGLWKSNTGLTCKCALGYTVFANISCDSHCNDSNFEFPCGMAETNIMSVYNTDNERIISKTDDTCTSIECSCLSFTYNNTPSEYIFKWRTCMKKDFSLQPLCNNHNFSDDNQTAVIPNSVFKETWASASEVCCAAGKYPATYTSILSTSFSNTVAGQERWTGVIRKLSTIKRTENFTLYEIPAVSVAVLHENGTVVFKDGTQPRKHLCHPPISNTTTSTKSYTAPEETTASLGTEDSGSTAGLAAGVSVSLVLLIVGAIIVLMFLKRRKLLPKCHKQTDETSNHTANTATENSYISTPVFESSTNTMHDLTASNHSYFVLEKTFGGVNKIDADHYAEPDATDFDHCDLTETPGKDIVNDYDTTDGRNGTAATKLAKQDSNYNKVTLHRFNEYDHIHKNGTLLDRQIENEYDISSNIINGKRNKRCGDDDNTYNQLHKHNLKGSGKDDIHGKREADGDSGYDTFGDLKGSRNAAAKEPENGYAVVKKKW
ncbi:uncharacterized protein LOC128240487 isoform X2 [Mya arenaria]|uniref:uncharacterized protein LOC128240487 isoform X2 n=1 Tax=Mya arenaria TaxID=6604 RepID=UPI0022E4142F|nr:uncharacterized protein LOC128240487 isoform X2 [Mya arenaria]